MFGKEIDSQVLYFFNHETCRNTLAIEVERFADLIEEPIPPKFATCRRPALDLLIHLFDILSRLGYNSGGQAPVFVKSSDDEEFR